MELYTNMLFTCKFKALYFGVLCPLICASQATISTFLSRPDLRVPAFNINSIDATYSSPGYWFFSTWGGSSQLAPYIYDNHGDLVWSGYSPELGDMCYWDLKVFELVNKSSRLSMFRGAQKKGHGHGHVVLLDEAYKIQQTLTSAEQGTALDFHDFQILQGGKTAIVVKYLPVQCDLSTLGVKEGMGWVYDGVFQEMKLDTGEIVFEWHSINHVPISESKIPFNGAGTSFSTSWDYFHINSVDKYPNGDYLISARHVDCIYKISYKQGSIIWRLGGNNSSYTLQGFNFSAQHDARIQMSPSGSEQISFYNNAWNGITKTRNYSSAFLIELEPLTMTATLVEEWFPSNGGLARHQGNVQHLPNGNYFIYWGGIPEFSEFSSNGTRVLDVAFSDSETLNYRAWKHPWTGRPDTIPDLYMYALSSFHDTHYYVSWNGATEVDTWNIYGLYNTSDSKTPILLGHISKQGFESHYSTSGHVYSGVVEALDSKGQVLARSELRSTFIPPETIAPFCGPANCTFQSASSTSVKLENKSSEAGSSKDSAELIAGWYLDSNGVLGLEGKFTIAAGGLTLFVIGFWAGSVLRRSIRKMKDLFLSIATFVLKKRAEESTASGGEYGRI